MASSSPLVEAVEHFSLAQLMADPNLCRNVLNDIGARPAEVFLLVAALEARIPQTLIEHSATNDLSVVEPRLVAELNERGVERSRAEWAVNAWKEVVGGSTLGQQTVRPGQPATVRPGQPATVRPSQPATVRPSQPATARPTAPTAGRQPEPAVVADRPAPQSSTVPQRREGRRRTGLIVAAAIVVLLVAGLGAWLAWPSSKHGTASPGNTGSSHSGSSQPGTSHPGSPSAGSKATRAANLTAPLGPPSNFSASAKSPWTGTGLTVTKGERINIVATGQIAPGPGKFCDPDGYVADNLDVVSIIGGGQHHAALIGLVAGSGLPFFVGANYNNLAPATGRLYVGINDVGLTNNSGQYAVTVRLQQS